MKVKVANNQFMMEFTFDLRLLEIGGCDVVLGMDWIDSVVPVVLNTRTLAISFVRDSQVIH